MLSDHDILKRLHEKRWEGYTLRDRDKAGKNALMVALQHPYQDHAKGQVYFDQKLVEALLNHADIDPCTTDSEGDTAFWYCWDAEHAYPLLISKGVDINQLNNNGEHFLIEEIRHTDYDKRDDIEELHLRIRLAIELGMETDRTIQGIPFRQHFKSEDLKVFDLAVAQRDKERLSKLPEALGIKQRVTKL